MFDRREKTVYDLVMGRTYKTSEVQRARTLARYHQLLSERGEAFLAEKRAEKAVWRAKGNDKGRHKKCDLRFKLVKGTRKRSRAKGILANIVVDDLLWPAECPVLGLPLDYRTPLGKRLSYKPNNPSLDRRDPFGGYVKGNVFVISQRANTLKARATADGLDRICKTATAFEYARIAAYITNGLACPPVTCSGAAWPEVEHRNAEPAGLPSGGTSVPGQ